VLIDEPPDSFIGGGATELFPADPQDTLPGLVTYAQHGDKYTGA
jgi:hypothetical protein